MLTFVHLTHGYPLNKLHVIAVVCTSSASPCQNIQNKPVKITPSKTWRMINIPTELLRTLVAVVDLRSFTKAAQSLGVTQPAVSAQIKRLQVLLDSELFDKSAPGVSLTPSGRLVVNFARRMLSINDQIVEISVPRLSAQSIRIGVSGDFAAPAAAALACGIQAALSGSSFLGSRANILMSCRAICGRAISTC